MADNTDEFYKEPTRKEWMGFWTLVAVQAQNAFNEKAVQFLLIPLGVWLWGATGSTLEYMLGAIFVLPYILFSPLVGWLADCFCKTRIIQVMSILQFFVMGCMLFCFYQHDMYAAIIWFAVFATQATILSPAKKGIVKDLLGSRYIGFGSGIIEMSMVFVLLLAQIGVFFWFSYLLGEYSQLPDGEQEAGWNAVIFPTWIFLGLAAVVSAAAFLVPRYCAKKANPFRWSLLYEHFVQIKYLWKDRLLRISELGISFFWCLAGSLFLILIQIAKGMQAQNPDVDFSLQCGILMAWLTCGVISGGAIASQLCKGKNELGLIPFGAIGIALSTMLLSILDATSTTSHVMLALTGFFGAMYLVPLNAYLQDNCDPAHRGNIIAAGNLIDNLMGLVAVALMWVMHEIFGCSPQNQYFILFLMSVFIMVTSLRLIPQEFIRMVGIWGLKFFYTPRGINLDRIPERGGALLVVNHITYADALFLTMVCPRTVRFIVAEEFMGYRLLNWILEIFNSLPISSKNPREAIIKAAEGIKKGDLICIFPEGQLTRTGCLSPIRRGMEMIARRAQAPIIPIYMDGLWGSIFSFYRNRFFTKLPKTLPYPFTVAVGKRQDYETFSTAQTSSILRELSATCLESSACGSKDDLIRKLELKGNSPLVFFKNGALTGIQIAAAIISKQVPQDLPQVAQSWISQLIRATADLMILHRLLMNVSQVRRVNALKEGTRHRLLTTVGHDEPQEQVLSVLWPIVTGTPVHLIDAMDEKFEADVSQIVGGSHMRRLLLTAIPRRQIPFFDFSNGADISTPNMRWRPCYACISGIIISMSMCKSVFKLYDGTIQLGSRPRTRGLLLPGFYTEGNSSEGEGITVCGPSLYTPVSLPSKIYLDESGFLAELS